MDNTLLTDIEKKIERFHTDYVKDQQLSKILLSPLGITGQLKSLLLTHNSWFLNIIVPQITKSPPLFTNFSISPALFFNAMNFEHWMDNGMAYPPSAKKLEKLKMSTQNQN